VLPIRVVLCFNGAGGCWEKVCSLEQSSALSYLVRRRVILLKPSGIYGVWNISCYGRLEFGRGVGSEVFGIGRLFQGPECLRGLGGELRAVEAVE